MANADTPFGLRPVRHRSGAPYNGAANPYYKAAGYGTALYVGEVVVKTGTANTARASAPSLGEFNIATLPEIQKTTAGDSSTDAERQTGVVVGFGANPDNLSRVYSPASTEAIVWVCDDPSVVFEAQCPSAIAATQIGLNAILLDTHAGSTVTGLAGVEIDGGDGTAPGADASYQVLILRAVNRTDNETNAVHNKLEVVLNNHTEATGMVTNAYGTLGI
jgi:hypothetical protein